MKVCCDRMRFSFFYFYDLFALIFILNLSLAARVGRKRGKMNLEKTMNKKMFDMSSAIHNANPLVPCSRTKSDSHDQPDSPISTPLSSILANPKQKLTTQFKRAFTAIKQRTDPSSDSPPNSASLPPRIDKTLDSTILTTLIEEQTKSNDVQGQMSTSSTLTPKSQSFVQLKSQPSRSTSNQILNPNTSSTATVLTIDPPSLRTTHPNSPSARSVKQSLQHIHSSILQTMNQHHPLSPQPTATSSSSATLSPTPSSSTMGTGEVAILETIL